MFLQMELFHYFYAITCSNIFTGLPPRVMEITLIKLKMFLHSKENHKQKDNPQNGSKYLQMK